MNLIKMRLFLRQNYQVDLLLIEFESNFLLELLQASA